MSATISNSLVISTYNLAKGLELCLLSILSQTKLPNEVIIADDGSNNETKSLIQAFQSAFSVPLIHVWHEDLGFRKTLILNKSIGMCKGDYIIQIDGDIILHPNFIEEHLVDAEQGYFIRGSRSSLNCKKTNELFQTKEIDLNFFSAGIINRFNAFHNKFFSNIHGALSKPESSEDVIGCNMSFWKKDFIAVNGYNNEITGWGREDREFAARLINNGIRKKTLKYRAVCFHLYHSIYSRENDVKNIYTVKQVIENKIKQCANGYLQSDAG